MNSRGLVGLCNFVSLLELHAHEIIVFELGLNHHLNHAHRIFGILKSLAHRLAFLWLKQVSHERLVRALAVVPVVFLDVQRVVKKQRPIGFGDQVTMGGVDAL